MPKASQDQPKKVLLIDTAALMFRAHYAFFKNPLTRTDGKVISALYGTCNTFLSVLDQIRPDYVIPAIDLPGKTFRHTMYEDYKANRPPCPEDLSWQLNELPNLCHGLGLKAVSVEGYEADDIIGTFATLAGDRGLHVDILSGDKDFMQLLRPGVQMVKPAKGDVYERLDEKGVFDKIGVYPNQVVDYLALVGDSSDNVPGAPGVGPKTASKLLAEYQNLETILDSASGMKKKNLSNTLIEKRGQIELSRDLVIIKTDMNEVPDLEEFAYAGLDLAQAEKELANFEMPRILSRIRKMGGAKQVKPKEQEKIKLQLIENREILETVLEQCRRSQKVSVQFKFEDHPLEVNPCGFAVVWSKGEGAYADLDREWLSRLGYEDCRDFFWDWTSILDGKVGAWDLKPMIQYFGRNNINIQFSYDTHIESSILEPGKNEDLFQSARRVAGYDLPLPEEVLGTGRNKKTFTELEVQVRGEWLTQQAEASFRLGEIQRDLLAKDGLLKLYEELEKPLISVIAAMESRGVKISLNQLDALSHEYQAEIEELKKKIFEVAGHEFNVNSTQQLSKVLFEELKIHDQLGIKKIKKTKTGYSTDSSVLESLSEHELPKTLLRYRMLTKLKSTYLEAFPKEVLDSTGKIHTDFGQNRTATGRMSSHNPNLQNIPMRTLEGSKIRELFIPSQEGRVLISADYSQIELRVLAHFSEDEALLEAFEKGHDIHATTASIVYGVDLNGVDREQRSRAKAVNFGLLYGMGPRHLSQTTGMSMSESKDFIRQYFESFPRIRDFLKGMVESARECGFATTLAGRKRPLPDLASSNGMLRSAAENMALNTPIQGSAADIIKVAMLRLDEKISTENLDLALLLQVHDELVFESDLQQVERLKEVIREEMEQRTVLGTALKVPLVVEVKEGANWLAAHH